MNIAIIGTGYIGLVTGVGLAHIGHTVVCVDIDMAKIAQLQSGKISIYEPGLEEIFLNAVSAGRLRFSTDVVQATRDSDCVFLAVNTPSARDGTTSDLSYLFAAAKHISNGIDRYKMIVVKSTVPAGTCRKLEQFLRDENPDVICDVVSNPEFLREGAAVKDFMAPDRIVFGTASQQAAQTMREIYMYFQNQNVPFLHTSWESAELIKFASNAFLATKIAFINEMAELCEASGAAVKDVAKGMGLDNRIGPQFLQSGPGFGGSCFPKDIRALSAMAQAVNVPLQINDAVIASNDRSKDRVVQTIKRLAGGDIDAQKIVVFGVTFKPDTDDMREAPALTVVPALLALGAEVTIVDPEGRKHGEALLPGAIWELDPLRAVHGADMIVVLTEWKMFKSLDLKALRAHMRRGLFADFRNVYSKDQVAAAGFENFYFIGHS